MISFDTEIAKYANKIIYVKENLKDNLSIIHSELAEGLLTQDDKGNSILHYLVSKNAEQAFIDVLNIIHKDHSFLNKKCKTKGCTCLKDAFEIANHKGMTISHIAAGLKANGILARLMEDEVNLFAQNQDKLTPVEIAIKADNAEFLNQLYLRPFGKETLLMKFAGKSLLHLAVEASAYEIVDLLCNFEELKLLNTRDFVKSTPIIIAASLSDIDIIKILLKHNANIELNNGQNKSAAEIALEKGHYKIVPMLVKGGANVNSTLANELGYSRTKALVMALVSHLVDSRGTFIGLKAESQLTQRFRDDLLKKIKEFKFSNSAINNIESSIDKLVANLIGIKITRLSTARDQDEITKLLAPYINKFIGEIAYE
jgi:ankyrin repeat protein